MRNRVHKVRKVLKLLLTLGTFCFTNFSLCSAQKHIVDSMCSVLKTEVDDTNKAITLNLISNKLWRMDNYDTAMAYANKAEALSEKLGYKKGITSAYRNIGTIYYNRGIYPKGLEYFLKALAIDKTVGYKKGVSTDLTSIANVFYFQADYSKALDYYQQALDIAQEVKDKENIARNLGNMGNIYHKQGNYPKALEYDSKALEIKQKIGDKSGTANTLSNIAQIYSKQDNYSKALEYDFQSLAMARSIGYKSIIALDLVNIGNVYTKQKHNAIAKAYLDSAVVLSKDIKGKEILKSAYEVMAILDSATGNYKSTFEDYKNYIVYRDSLINEANTKKTVQAEMNFDFEQKQAVEKAEQDKKDAIAEQQRKKQAVIRNSFIAGFILMLALAFFIYRGYRQKKEANILITKQKEEVENQKSIVEEQKKLVEQQKDLVEEKNKEILDSITYAKRLQDAILPPLSLIKQYLPDSFVLYKPKDVVSGDFYWMERAGDMILIAAADCTGHGVPGALVSVVCSNALNRTVKEFKITEPGKILDKVRELVLETFEKSESNVQDGMDVSLIAISRQSSVNSIEIQWSGAHNPLWFCQNNEIKEIAPDKQPIGKFHLQKPFSTNTLNLKKGDILYLFTDGYADQFGGPKGKKFKYKQLSEKLKEISDKPIDEQKNILEQTLENWKGNLEQIDDVLLIGIRV